MPVEGPFVGDRRSSRLRLRDELPSGAIVGDFTIDATLGHGTFGAVYAATSASTGQRVAIKLLHEEHCEDPQVVSRFMAEARAVDRLNHPNIVHMLALSELPGGRPYQVLELLEGVTLEKQLAAQTALPVREGIALLRAVAEAIGAAHAAGITHRDLKPDNIFMARDAHGGVSPKLLDFGIAKLVDPEALHDTAQGMPLGTPCYMSPEQIQGLKNIDHRTDIYSFGIIAHELFTGSPPFQGKTPLQIWYGHQTQPPPPMVTKRPDLPPGLDAPVSHMLAKNAGDRPPNIEVAVGALIEAARAAGIDTDTALGAVETRNKPAVAIVVVIVVFVLLAGVGALLLLR